MAKSVTKLQIIVASPNDVADERIAVDSVVSQLNIDLSERFAVIFETIKWESHTAPDIGSDPQEVINRQLPKDYDFLILILWSRIGTKTPRSISGSIEEFENALARNKKDGSVKIMVYFKTAPIPQDRDIDQYVSVRKFKESCAEQGVYYKDFLSLEEFSRVVHTDLLKHTLDLLGIEPSIQKQTIIKASEYDLQQIEQEPTSEINDLGFLELVDLTVSELSIATTTQKQLTDELKTQTQKTNSTVEKMNQIKSSNIIEQNKGALYQRIINEQADIMNDFSQAIEPKIPIYKNAILKALYATQQVYTIFSDFGATAKNKENLTKSVNAIKEFKSTTVTGKSSFENLRLVIIGLPRLTSKFINAKQRQLALFDNLISVYDQALEIADNVIEKGDELLTSYQ